MLSLPLILTLLFFSLVTASKNPLANEKLVENSPTDKKTTFESRHRSLAHYQASPPSPEQALSLHKKSPKAVLSSTMSLDSNDPQTIHQKQRLIDNYRSFNSLPRISYETAQVTLASHPLKSQIIAQLSILDNLMASAKFSIIAEPVPLIVRHLSVLKGYCRNLIENYGPRSSKYVKCAARYYELDRFIKFLIKYDLNFSNFPTGRNPGFCSAFQSNFMRLQSLMTTVIYSYLSESEAQSKSKSLKDLEFSVNPKIMDLLAGYSKELKDLDTAIDTFDLGIKLFCDFPLTDHETFHSVGDLIIKFLNRAFA